MLETLGGCETPILLHREHPLENVDELCAVETFARLLGRVEIRARIHLSNVVEAIEHVLAGLFRLYRRLAFVLFGRLKLNID